MNDSCQLAIKRSFPEISPHSFRDFLQSQLKSKAIRIARFPHRFSSHLFYWYKVEGRIEDRLLVSTGESFKKSKAQGRAIGEFLERIPLVAKGKFSPYKVTSHGVLKQTNPALKNSNGLSFSMNPTTAIMNSYRELIERHVVLKHWLYRLPVLQVSGLNRWVLLNALSSKKEQVKARFLFFPNSYGLKVIACQISSATPPFRIFGYGCYPNLDDALEKAYVEAWRFYYEEKIVDSSFKCPPQTFEKCIDHFKYYAYVPQDDEPFVVESKIMHRILKQKTLPFDIDFQNTHIYVYDLADYGWLGYSAHVSSNELLGYDVGPLQKDRGSRKSGEVHPIA